MEQYLEHHGILGQRWGIRRYQNPDGSLTNAGKKRYIEGDFKLKDVRIARKSYKKVKDKSNSEKIAKEYGHKIFKAEKNSLNRGDGLDSIKVRNLAYEGHKAIINQKLLDAGYSKEKAQKGAEWFMKHGYNVNFDDTSLMYKTYYNDWDKYDY